MYEPRFRERVTFQRSARKLREYYERYDSSQIESFFDELYSDPDSLEEVVREASLAMAHENVHRQQHQGRFWDLRKDSKIDPETDYPGYVAQGHEVDAHSAGVAEEWTRINRDPRDRLEKLSRADFSDLTERTRFLVEEYRTIGGETWRRFLDEVYRYLEEPEPSRDSNLRRRVGERRWSKGYGQDGI